MPKIFLSGWQATNYARELAVIQSGYLQARCFSFAHITKIPGLPYYVPGAVAALDICIQNKIPIMFDSGVVSWRSYRATCEKQKNSKALAKLCNEQEFIQLYVDHIKTNCHNYELYMTIDLERVAKNIFERHFKIEAMGIKPVPVFHGDSTVDWIKKYADKGHDLIAIASWRTLRNGREQFRRYMDAVFGVSEKLKIRIHGLAFTALYQLFEFPFWSVDSSSWSRVAGYGGIMLFDPDKCRLSNINISDRATAGSENLHKLNPKAMESVKEHVTADGFDFETLRTDFVQRHIFNARAMHLMAQAAEKRHRTGNWNLLFS